MRLLLSSLKKIKSVIEWATRSGDDDKGGWDIGSDSAACWLGSYDFATWHEWRTRGNYPKLGGWADQPLNLLATFQAYELAYLTYTSNEKGDWYALDKLNATQRDLVRWLENETENDKQSETN